MISSELAFYAPATLAEALEQLAAAEYGATILAGGMSLVPTMNLGLARPETVISLNRIDELAYIEEDADTIRIGAMTRHRDLIGHPIVQAHCPSVAAAASVIGDVQIRNRGTIGGSVAHADPAGDYLPVLAAAGATAVVRSATSERRIGAREFVVDIMRTALEPGELLTELELPKLPADGGSAFVRLARVEGAFAIVNAAAVTSGGSATIAVGGATASPAVAEVAGDASLEEAGDAVYEATEDAFGDLSGSAEYRREMARVYARRALAEARDAAANGGGAQ